MTWLALDVGGANIKLADGAGYVSSEFFPLWQKPAELSQVLAAQIDAAPPTLHMVVTMTGELADCFVTKAAGVRAILDAVESAADGRETVVYLCNGEFAAPQAARAAPLLAAASNWHALASYAARYCAKGSGLLIDIGSTTTDIIPINPTGPTAIGKTDPERLATRELVYTGVRRSPVCALVNELLWRGESCATAQELFATTADVFVLLGYLDEDFADNSTADGQPLTRDAAHVRLARMVCADTSLFSMDDAMRAAETIFRAQLDKLCTATQQVLGRMETQPETIVISGEGEFLVRALVERMSIPTKVVSLLETLGPELSRAATSHSLAILAREWGEKR